MTMAVRERIAPGRVSADHETLLHEVIQRMVIMRSLMKQVGKQGRAESDAHSFAKMGEGQYHALHVLTEEERMTTGELALRCNVADPTISKVLKSLEKAGLVIRQTDPNNRRVVWVSLTAAGRAMHDQMVAHFEAGLARVLRPLTEAQLNDLVTAFRHIESLLDPPTARPGA